MSVVNRILVTCRLENGNTVDVSFKVTNRGYTADEATKFHQRLEKEIAPLVDDTLHYQVRTWGGNAGKDRKNWSKVPTMEKLYEIVSEVMKVEKVSA